jgi:sulfonate transport system permease protein
MSSRLGAWALSIAVFAAVIALWWAAAHFAWVSKAFLPPPAAALEEVVAGLGIAEGTLRGQLIQTIWRMVQGWLLACLAGVVLGAAIGVSAKARAYLQPMLEFLRPLPASALLPLAIAIFGLGPFMVLSVVAFGAMWPVMLATIHGFAAIEPRLREVARCMQLTPMQFIIKIGVPNALPDVLAGMRLSLTVALIVSVVGEMIASQEGLGHAILLASRSFDAKALFAGVILLGLVGFASNSLLAFVERRALRWQHP